MNIPHTGNSKKHSRQRGEIENKHLLYRIVTLTMKSIPLKDGGG